MKKCKFNKTKLLSLLKIQMVAKSDKRWRIWPLIKNSNRKLLLSRKSMTLRSFRNSFRILKIPLFISLPNKSIQRLRMKLIRVVLRSCSIFGKTISFRARLNMQLKFWDELLDRFRWIELKEGNHTLVHLLTSLDLEKTQDSAIAECRAYYHFCLITYQMSHLPKYLR